MEDCAVIETQPFRPHYHLTVGHVTDPGNRYDHNEDNYRFSLQGGWFVLADGMGGHQAGEIASRLAVETVAAYLESPDVSDAAEFLKNVLLAAHQVIHEQAQQTDSYYGMGTTALVALLGTSIPSLWVAHVGNSRAYLFRDGRLTRLTEDHTMVNELRRAGMLPDDPEDWPPANVLSQAIGSKMPIAPEVHPYDIRDGDLLLFCTDGVTDVHRDDELEVFLRQGADPQDICNRIVESTKKKGAPDNLTIIVVRVQVGSTPHHVLANKEEEVLS